jgi:hypothetical protein
MKRRDLLKALGVLPVASTLSGWANGQSESTQRPKTGGKVHTLQILLEGAFAVVLQRDIGRITAFVPRPDPKSAELAHYFYFNDPENRKDLGKQHPNGYHFELGEEGLRRYPKTDPDPYINPGFNDFVAETQKWTVPESIVTIRLPFPRSINFTGRPLEVRFGPKALKPRGMMPTNHILEYGVGEEHKIFMKCDDKEGHCATSPFCPPGVMRFYFGVRPIMNEPDDRQKHAVAFFNFLLERSFPELRQKYELAEIERADDDRQPPYSARPTRLVQEELTDLAVPAVLTSRDPKPQLLRVASMVDCQTGGILVNTRTAPIR